VLALVVACGLADAASGGDRQPVPPTATFVTQEQIAQQHLEFSFGERPFGQCGYVPNVVPPQISGDTSVGETVTTWPGQWNPCSPPLVAVDVYWPSDGSHGTAHVVTAADQLAGQVCSESSVWDSAGDVGGPLTTCIAIPGAPLPPACVINPTQQPWISGDAAVGSTLSMNGGSWQPTCGGGLRAADIRWWPDDSHSATYVVRSSDAGASVCGTVTVWDFNGAVAHDDACLAIPGAPPPPPPPPAGDCANDAAFVSEEAPDVIPVGWTFGATVTMRNTGSCTWTAGAGYRLASPDASWGPMLVPVTDGQSIVPGQTAAFAIAAAAPAGAGDYPFAWRMEKSGVGFGQGTTALTVAVIDAVDPLTSSTQGSSAATEDAGGGHRCRTVNNWHESIDVFHRVATRVEQGTKWCYRSGRFSCPAAQQACPFYRTLSADSSLPWSLERWEYGSCATTTCGDLGGRAWVGGQSATIWVEGVFKSCLFIRFIGIDFCHHNTEHVATTVRGDGSYTNW
jgi:hypothetical protein